MSSIKTNQFYLERAQAVIPGGVNSPVRAFKSVGGTPRFISRGQGAYLWDVEGQRYIDYIGSWGAAIAGHIPPAVLAAVKAGLDDGFSFGAPTPLEVEFAERLCHLLPALEQVRLVNSGTEATMSAIRLARGYSGRALLVKFDGCYHGHADALLVAAGSGLATFGHPDSAGVTAGAAADTVVLPFNDIAALDAFFQSRGKEVAAVIVEPVAGNMNLLPGNPAFLAALRRHCDQSGAVLIFDEVMSGFRVALGGASAVYGITPDLLCLGKVIGGGFPLAAFGGKKALMSALAPLGAVYQAGTLSGHPVAVRAGLATLDLITAPDFYAHLTTRTATLVAGLNDVGQRYRLPLVARHCGAMFGFYFCHSLPQSYEQIKAGDKAAFQRFFHAMLGRGIYFAPSMFEAGFVSSAHSAEDIAATLTAVDAVLSQWRPDAA